MGSRPLITLSWASQVQARPEERVDPRALALLLPRPARHPGGGDHVQTNRLVGRRLRYATRVSGEIERDALGGEARGGRSTAQQPQAVRGIPCLLEQLATGGGLRPLGRVLVPNEPGGSEITSRPTGGRGSSTRSRRPFSVNATMRTPGLAPFLSTYSQDPRRRKTRCFPSQSVSLRPFFLECAREDLIHSPFGTDFRRWRSPSNRRRESLRWGIGESRDQAPAARNCAKLSRHNSIYGTGSAA